MGISTREAAKRLGIPYSTLAKAVWDERVPAPARGPGGAFYWELVDLERASWALLGRAYKAAIEDAAGNITSAVKAALGR